MCDAREPTDDLAPGHRGAFPLQTIMCAGMFFVFLTVTLSALVTVVAAIVMGGYFSANSAEHPDDLQPLLGVRCRWSADLLAGATSASCNYLLLGSDSRKGLTEEEVDYVRGTTTTSAERTDRTRSSSCTPNWIDGRPRSSRSPSTCGSIISGMGWEDQHGVRGRDRTGVDCSGRPSVSVKQLTGMQAHHVPYVNLLGFKRSSTRSAASTCASPTLCTTS